MHIRICRNASSCFPLRQKFDRLIPTPCPPQLLPVAAPVSHISRLQSLLQLNAGTRNHAQAVGRREGNNRMDQDGRNASSYGDGGSGACFTEAGECLWLRVFSALETYARPFRSGDRKERAPLDLVPLQRAVSAIEEIFGRGSPAEAGSSLMSTAISKKREDSKRCCIQQQAYRILRCLSCVLLAAEFQSTALLLPTDL